MSFKQWRSPLRPRAIGSNSPSAILSGTAVPSLTEVNVVAGGFTIVITLLNDTWVAAGATFDAQRQNIINGSNGSDSDPNGWNAVVRATEVVTAIVQTSPTVVTWTLSAFPSFDILANSIVTFTVPATAVTSGTSYVATPTFTVTATASGVSSTTRLLLTKVGM